MKRFALLTAIALTCLAGPVSAQTADKTESTVEIRKAGEGVGAHIVNRSFLFSSQLHYGDDVPTRFLLRMETDVRQRDDAEGIESGTVSVTAWQVDGTKKRQIWTLREDGDTGELTSRRAVFIVTTHGCCGGRDVFSVFDLWGGRKLFTATGPDASDSWAQVEIPNSHGIERLVAFHAAYSMTDAAAFGPLKDRTVGLLTYAAPDRPLARYRLLVASADAVEGFMGQGLVRLRLDGKSEDTDSLELWPVDGQMDPAAMGGFAIRLQLTDDKIVVIPVKGDSLQIAKASLPPGLTIESESLP